MKNRFLIEWTETAALDLDEIIRFIAIDNPRTARQILKKIKTEVSQLNLFPFRGRVVPEFEIQGLMFFRELIIAPWRIMYRVSKNRVFILSVIDSRRNVEDILLNRFLREKPKA
ncbi:MAG: type II toxin-antitoxin system RelE/ParE family toxin [Candidatus Riflebacteria bacterium]|nr:type II toxin-antitoxin system RelE/ParE family toxin [Candidatus Riflebacteria bacterium]